MRDKRRERKAKQARRDIRRAKKRDREARPDTTFRDAIRSALKGHPVGLLSVASVVAHLAKPDPLRDETYVDEILTAVIGVRSRETTALLAVLAELLVDEPAAQLRCRQELADRDDPLPQWIAALPQIEVYRAVRRTHVLGDVAELVIGARINGHELTGYVRIDHTVSLGIADGGVASEPIDEVLAQVAASSTDTDVVEMTLADARVRIESAFNKLSFAQPTETWPICRPLVRWLTSRLPEGGQHRSPTMGWDAIEELCDEFFATDSASPFTDSGHRELLLELLDGDRDPSRWSAARVELAIGGAPYYDDRLPLEVALDAPDLLRAFIPYAHGQSGVRDGLTSGVIAVIDQLRSRYKREVLKQAAQYWDLDDAV